MFSIRLNTDDFKIVIDFSVKVTNLTLYNVPYVSSSVY